MAHMAKWQEGRSILARALHAKPACSRCLPPVHNNHGDRFLMPLSPLPLGAVRLLPGLFDNRRKLNAEYVASLESYALVQNVLLEAGIGDQEWHLSFNDNALDPKVAARHWGWETPGGLLRGHFLGHWLSAAARETAVTGNPLLRAKLDEVLSTLARCQREHGGEWIWAIPPHFLERLGLGLPTWAPQYAMHKTLMGLVDVYRDLGDERALHMAHAASGWIDRWSAKFEVADFQKILDVETGGMLEVWADLLEATGDSRYERLLERYWHHSLFDELVKGRDVLTNMHANTTIPEVLGAARAYEVTGESKWREVVMQYWRCAVTERGTFCTGGQTSGEVWTPPNTFAARRGDKTQEHCSVYNMMRLADFLFRWTADVEYLDYIECNLYNGILAQQHPSTAMPAYFLPLEGGARKIWGTPTSDFWCCHGTLVQAHTRHSSLVHYVDNDDGSIVIAQLIPSVLQSDVNGIPFSISLAEVGVPERVGPDANRGTLASNHRPREQRVRITVTTQDGVGCRVRIRVPSWSTGAPQVVSAMNVVASSGEGFLAFDHPGGTTSAEVAFTKSLRAIPVPDEPTTVAFADGPVVLAGLVDHECRLYGDPARPELLLAPDNERQWSQWLPGYRTIGQARSIRFRPLYEISDERYSVYFPVGASGATEAL